MRKLILLAVGWFCVAMGFVGLFVPMLPGVVFLIVAAACFSRASPRFEAWLLDHPLMGPPVRAWRDDGVIPTGIKLAAIASLAVSFTVIAILGAPLFVLAAVAAGMLGVAFFIVTRPSERQVP
jgi:uncharacterized membrane protein YbaN (DUF454 family)